jgi:hypothetical protein
MYKNKGSSLVFNKDKYFHYSKSKTKDEDEDEDEDDADVSTNVNLLASSMLKSKKCFFFSDESNYNISFDKNNNIFTYVNNNTRKQTEYILVNIFFFKEKDTECYILQTKEHAQFIKVILQICPFSYKFYDIWQHQPDNITNFNDMTRIGCVVQHLYQTYFLKKDKDKTDWLLYCLERRNVSAPWLQ